MRQSVHFELTSSQAKALNGQITSQALEKYKLFKMSERYDILTVQMSYGSSYWKVKVRRNGERVTIKGLSTDQITHALTGEQRKEVLKVAL